MKSSCPGRSRATSTALRLLDLDDHLGLREDGVRVGDDRRALCDVLVVCDRRALARAPLHENLVAVLAQLADTGRRQRDAVLVGLDLGWDSDLHG